jgi:hypothetical protein
MNPLSMLANAPAATLTRLATTPTTPGAATPQQIAPAGWDNRPSWDNWSRR